MDGSVMSQDSTTKECPLYVDMDGTLIATDVLWESLLLVMKGRPLVALRLPLWAMGHGWAYMKDQLAQRVMPDVARLPYRREVVEFLKEERGRGRRLVLATASNRRIAEAVAAHVGLFDDVLASGPEVNLKGERKLQAIEKQVGSDGFGYMGNSSADLPLWRSARQAYVVAASPRVLARARAVCNPVGIFEASP